MAWNPKREATERVRSARVVWAAGEIKPNSAAAAVLVLGQLAWRETKPTLNGTIRGMCGETARAIADDPDRWEHHWAGLMTQMQCRTRLAPESCWGSLPKAPQSWE